MFIDARQFSTKTELESDICIIGAGAAGITITREFIGANYNVILLESGAFQMDMATQSLYEGEDVGQNYTKLESTRSRYFGGSTNCWGGWCRPLDAIDFEAREWIPNSGWPFDKATLDPYYDLAWKVCSIRNNNDISEGSENLSLLQNHNLLYLSKERVRTQISYISPRPRFGEVYRNEIETAGNVRAILCATAIEIETNEFANEVTSVLVTTFTGKQLRVSSKRFVLATGGIENPRLLLASNRVATAGLGNQNDLVGRYFMDHPKLNYGELALNEATSPIELYDPYYTYFHSSIGASLSLSAQAQRTERLCNYHTWIISVYHGEDTFGGECVRNLYRAIRKKTMPDHFMETTPRFWLRNFGGVVADFPNAVATVYGRLSRSKRMRSKWALLNLCESVPNPDSRVTLSAKKDKLGQNKVCVDWRLSPLDKETIYRTQKIISGELERANIGRIENDCKNDFYCDLENNFTWSWHHMGTTRMHNDPKKGVVNANCKVHGISNFYIAGSSVFPTGGSDMPTMTIVALALRLADHLKRTFE